MDIKKILVPTDFSNAAHNALRYALDIAARYQSQVDIVHAFSIPVVTARGKPVLPDQDVIDANEQAAIEQLEALKKSIPENDDIKITCKALPVYWQLEFSEVVHQQHADLVVMGTTGASGLMKTFVGSNAARVIQQAHVPILAIPAQAGFARPGKIGFAYDHLPIEDMETLNIIPAFANMLGAEMHVFSIATLAGKPQTYPEALARLLPGASFNETAVVAEADIFDYLRENQLDMLVTITRQQGFFYNLVNGSLTNRVAYEIDIPLLAIPA